MTTQEKFDMIPAIYNPMFIDSKQELVSIQAPMYIGFDITLATIKVSEHGVCKIKFGHYLKSVIILNLDKVESIIHIV